MITNLLVSGSISSQFNLTITGVNNPITTGPLTGIKVSIGDQTSSGIYESLNITFTVPDPLLITGNLGLSIVDSNVVGELSGL